MLYAYFAMLPYRATSGGFHLKTHIGCIVATVLFYYGNIIFSNLFILQNKVYRIISVKFKNKPSYNKIKK